jgi:hypothetical protein
MKQLQLILVSLMISLAFASCKKDKDEVVTPPSQNEEELITTVTLSFKKSPTATDSVTFSWKDLDGDGGNPPVIDAITITSDYTYMSVHILNESNPADIKDITEEIKEEADEHQLFYTTSTSFMNLTYLDRDDNNVPIGLRMELSGLTATSDGTLQVILKHQPGIKPTSGLGNASLGASDFDVTFPITITLAPILITPILID